MNLNVYYIYKKISLYIYTYYTYYKYKNLDIYLGN